MLTIEKIHFYYGGIHALRNVSVSIDKNDTAVLIGSNGAGKSTLMNCISGILPIQTGSITFNEIEITHLSTEKIVGQGIVQVPEGRQLFNPLTVLENLELGAYLRFAREEKKKIHKDLDYVMNLFPILKERRNQRAGVLSGGEQQMLSIGRALMGQPRLLLLDEPSLGLAPLIVLEIFNVIRKLHEDGITIFLVEQNAKVALKVASRVYVMEIGQVTFEGVTKDLLNDEDLKKAYLGGDYRERC